MSLRRASTIALSLMTGVPHARANVTGNGSQNFSPVTGAADFVTVQSSTVLNPGRLNLGLFLNQATNTLPYRSDAYQSRSKVNDSLVGLDMVLGAGILPGLEVGVAFPFLVDQSVKEDETRGEFEKTGNTEIKPVVKWAFLRRADFGLAAVISANVNRVEDDPLAGAGTSPVYNMELAADWRKGHTHIGVNLGYRMREPGDAISGALVEPFSDEALASLALAYGLTPKTSLVSEVYASKILEAPRNDTDRQAASAETLLGLRHAFTKTLTAHVGGGTELMHGFATPDWRLYAGLATEVGPGKERGHTVVEAKKRKKAKRAPEIIPASTGSEDNGPGIEAIPTEEPDEIFVLHNINFEFDSDYRVLLGAKAELDKLSAQLAKAPYTKLVIEGHTDYYGSDEYNEDLSLRRAQTVRRQLIKYYGINGQEAVAVGYGEHVPFTEDMSDRGRQLNRRVEIKIYRD